MRMCVGSLLKRRQLSRPSQQSHSNVTTNSVFPCCSDKLFHCTRGWATPSNRWEKPAGEDSQRAADQPSRQQPNEHSGQLDQGTVPHPSHEIFGRVPCGFCPLELTPGSGGGRANLTSRRFWRFSQRGQVLVGRSSRQRTSQFHTFNLIKALDGADRSARTGATCSAPPSVGAFSPADLLGRRPRRPIRACRAIQTTEVRPLTRRMGPFLALYGFFFFWHMKGSKKNVWYILPMWTTERGPLS